MKNFYTNVQCVGNYILYRGVSEGKRVKAKVEYSPSLFVPSKKKTKYTTLRGDFLDEMLADRSIKTAKDIQNFKNKRLQIERERRSYLRDFSGTAEPTAQAQKIINWLHQDGERRQQIAEDAAKQIQAVYELPKEERKEHCLSWT